MGGALLSGWMDASLIGPKNLAVLDPTPGAEAVYAIERGARHLGDVNDIPRAVSTVLLSVKPQTFAAIADTLAAHIPPTALVMSIMAGVPLARLEQAFPTQHIIRAMPNTPAAVGRGVMAFVAGASVTEDVLVRAKPLLEASGDVFQLQSDAQIDAVTAISGSGPAYIFHLVEALEASARALGLPSELAGPIARSTVTGSSALLDASERSASTLREAVTSPGGTTQAALSVLMGETGLEDLMRRATRAAMDRAGELSG